MNTLILILLMIVLIAVIVENMLFAYFIYNYFMPQKQKLRELRKDKQKLNKRIDFLNTALNNLDLDEEKKKLDNLI